MYTVSASGTPGNLFAILLADGEKIAEDAFKTVKDIQKWAKAHAELHKRNTLPASTSDTTVSHTSTFHL